MIGPQHSQIGWSVYRGEQHRRRTATDSRSSGAYLIAESAPSRRDCQCGSRVVLNANVSSACDALIVYVVLNVAETTSLDRDGFDSIAVVQSTAQLTEGLVLDTLAMLVSWCIRISVYELCPLSGSCLQASSPRGRSLRTQTCFEWSRRASLQFNEICRDQLDLSSDSVTAAVLFLRQITYLPCPTFRGLLQKLSRPARAPPSSRRDWLSPQDLRAMVPGESSSDADLRANR